MSIALRGAKPGRYPDMFGAPTSASTSLAYCRDPLAPYEGLIRHSEPYRRSTRLSIKKCSKAGFEPVAPEGQQVQQPPPNPMEAEMAQSSRAMLRKGGLLGEFTDLLASVKHLFDSYHPERHYMRGPGPA